MFQKLFQNAKEHIEKMNENGVQVRDVPFVAALLFIAAVVVIGELACVVWLLAIVIKALFMDAVVLLQLLPCLGIMSFLTAIIISFYMWVMEECLL